MPAFYRIMEMKCAICWWWNGEREVEQRRLRGDHLP